jgi:hypothetical protein
MLKRFVIAVFILVSGLAMAQEDGSPSPYSFYGIGTLKFKGTTENRSMGGIGVFSDSIHLNLQNPASIATLGLVNYSLGGSHTTSTLKNEEESQTSSSTTLDYLAVGVPMGKFGASFGLEPYSTVGYRITSGTPSDTTNFVGTGGLNRAFVTLGYQVTSDLSIGAEVNYNFGNIENTATTIENDVQYGTLVFNRSEIMGFSFNLGAMYKTMLNDDLQLSTSLTYTPETNFTAENSRVVASVQDPGEGNVIPVDAREVDVANTDFTFPSQVSIGAGIGQPKKWFVGAEYTNQKTSNFTNRTFTVSNTTFENASKFRIGGFYIPEYNSFGNYTRRITYRAGFRMEETGLNIDGQSINEFGISFGVGLPVGRIFSNANIGFELGRRGTTDNGLIQENFFKTFISLSLNDRWFEKRYYD